MLDALRDMRREPEVLDIDVFEDIERVYWDIISKIPFYQWSLLIEHVATIEGRDPERAFDVRFNSGKIKVAITRSTNNDIRDKFTVVNILYDNRIYNGVSSVHPSDASSNNAYRGYRLALYRAVKAMVAHHLFVVEKNENLSA